MDSDAFLYEKEAQCLTNPFIGHRQTHGVYRHPSNPQCPIQVQVLLILDDSAVFI